MSNNLHDTNRSLGMIKQSNGNPKFIITIVLALFITLSTTLLIIFVIKPYTDIKVSIKNDVKDFKKDILAQESYVLIDDIAQPNDRVIIDFQGYINEKSFENNTVYGESFIIGSNKFDKDFEEAIINHKAGDTFTKDITFPNEATLGDLANQKVTFYIQLREVYRFDDSIVMNDAFVLTLSKRYKEFKDIKTVKDLDIFLTKHFEETHRAK